VSKARLQAKGREWREVVSQVFTEEEQPDVLNVLGLFILNKFRRINYQEVMNMLYFDLLETTAGQDMFKMGLQKGIIQDAQEMVVEALKVRFGRLPRTVITQVRQIDQHRLLKKLHQDALRCSTLDQFKEELPTTKTKK
jgi:hypothetical protein